MSSCNCCNPLSILPAAALLTARTDTRKSAIREAKRGGPHKEQITATKSLPATPLLRQFYTSWWLHLQKSSALHANGMAAKISNKKWDSEYRSRSAAAPKVKMSPQQFLTESYQPLLIGNSNSWIFHRLCVLPFVAWMNTATMKLYSTQFTLT